MGIFGKKFVFSHANYCVSLLTMSRMREEISCCHLVTDSGTAVVFVVSLRESRYMRGCCGGCMDFSTNLLQTYTHNPKILTL